MRTGHDAGGRADRVPRVVTHGDATEEDGEGAGAAGGGGADVGGDGDGGHEDDLAVGVVVSIVEKVCNRSAAVAGATGAPRPGRAAWSKRRVCQRHACACAHVCSCVWRGGAAAGEDGFDAEQVRRQHTW